MKLAEHKQNLHLEGIQKTEFKIKASAKAFDILSSKLYSDPILAIVRELSTNMVDAHIQAGNTSKKYDVSIPTPMTPYYVVRDYGSGLTPDAVENIFTTIFESTKTDSNDVTGCLGLGSKSPFAYVDSYNVDSYVDGKLYHYTCFKDEYGIPCVAFLGEEDTDEPNGLKITIAVKVSDCIAFERAAQKVYPYLAIQPNWLTKQVVLKKIEYVESGADWGVVGSNDTRPNGYSGLVAVMGGVAYPVANKIDTSDMTEVERSFVQANIDLNLNIGDVDIEAGREGLQFTKRTQNVLKHKFKKIVAYFVEKVQKEFDHCKTPWEAYCYANDYNGAIGYHITNHILSKVKLTIGGKTINPLNHRMHFNKIGLFVFQRGGRGYTKKKTHTVIPSAKTVVIWDDQCKASYARSRYYQEQNTDKNVYFLQSTDPLDKEYFIKTLEMGPDDVIDSSTLPKKPHVKGVSTGASGGVKKKTAKVVAYRGGYSPQNAWGDSTLDIYSKEYYVPVERYNPMHDGRVMQIGSIESCLEALKAIGKPFAGKVYGLRTTLIEKVKKDTNCKVINFFDYVKSEVEAADVKNSYIQKYADHMSREAVVGGVKKKMYEVLQVKFSSIDKTGVMGRFMEAVSKSDHSATFDACRSVYRFMSIFPNFVPKKPSVDLTKLENDVTFKYKFLSVLRHADTSILNSHLVDYINGIDKL